MDRATLASRPSFKSVSALLPRSPLVGVQLTLDASLVTKMIIARDPMDELKRAFKLFAPEGKRITVDHLAKVAQDLGENLDHEELYVSGARSLLD
jgi:hypothetical protein